MRSIPLGTLLALLVSTLIYISTTLTLTRCHDRANQLINTNLSPISDSSASPLFVFLAIAATSFGRSFTGLATGPMVLRCMAGDGIVHKFFGDNARALGLFFTVPLCLWGDLNTISSLSSFMFLLVFSFLNYGLFTAYRAKIPSFRPHFRIYNPWVSICCCFLLITSMFIINWVFAIICMVCCGSFYFYLTKKHIKAEWGAMADSVAYNNALKSVIELKKIPLHPKLYRPNVVLVIENSIEQHMTIINFLDQLLRGRGLAIVANVFPCNTPIKTLIDDRQNNIIPVDGGFSYFYETVIAHDKVEAINKLMLLTGLGALRPNIAFSEFDETLSKSGADFIGNVLDKRWSIMILRSPRRIPDFGNIDLWWLSDDGGLSLLMSSILSGNSRPLRVITVAQRHLGQNSSKQSRNMRHLLKQFRVQGSVVSLSINEESQDISHQTRSLWRELTEGLRITDQVLSFSQKYMILADLLSSYSSQSDIVIISLPVPRKSIPGEIYMRLLSLISSLPVPVLFIRGNGTHTLSWQL